MKSRVVGTGRTAVLVATLAFAGAVLAACQSNDVTGSIRQPEDYRQRHPIIVGQQLETLDIPVGADVPVLADRMRGNITGFAQKYHIAGAARLAVVLPRMSPTERVARGIARQAVDALVAAGVPRRTIEYRTYTADIDGSAPVKLVFARIGARVDNCGTWPESDSDPANKIDNRSYYNFGCSTQQNLAASVVDPLDLLYPRGMSAADATRRVTVLNQYEKSGAEASGTVLAPGTTGGN